MFSTTLITLTEPLVSIQIVCILYTVYFTLMLIAILYFFTIALNGMKFAFVEEQKYSEFYFLHKYLELHSAMLLSMHFTFLLYLIHQKIAFINCAVLNALDYFDKRNNVGVVEVFLCLYLVSWKKLTRY